MPMTSLDLWRLVRPLLFRLDPEVAHDLTLAGLAFWSRRFAGRLPATHPARDPHLAVSAMGLRFPNRVGLAAGLDKDAAAIPAWQALGFGFIEVGTITPVAQPGNPKPRLVRYPREEAILNRMGFNNAGAVAVAARLRALRDRGLPEVPLGVNLGKAKVTPAAAAAADYRRGFSLLGDLADYVVVNLSSPNTPGLRDLQRVDEVQRILEAIQGPNQQLSTPRPLLLKLAPDLTDADAIACSQAALAAGAAGLVLTNTTLDYQALAQPPAAGSGGLSGRPLQRRSTELLAAVRAAIGPGPVLIGVGGILDADAALAKLAAGATLIQLYSGLIYRGPRLVRELLDALRRSGASVSG